MLILSRRPKESIMIGDNIEVTVVEIYPNQIKLAISAPRNIPIYRKEIYDEIKKQNIQSSDISPSEIDNLTKFVKK